MPALHCPHTGPVATEPQCGSGLSVEDRAYARELGRSIADWTPAALEDLARALDAVPANLNSNEATGAA